MVSPADFLLTLAEISIAFVGFSAIVIVFRRFGAGPGSAFQNLQVSIIIEMGLLALLLSLLPLLLSMFPIDEITSWRLASLLFSMVSVLLIATYSRRRSHVQIPPEVSRRRYLVRTAAAALLIVLQLLNALLLPASSVAAVYCLGIVWLLAIVSHAFVGMWQLWGASDGHAK